MWEVYAYGNSASLAGVFNAIAAVTGAGDYRAALALVVVCGFLVAALSYTFAPQKLAGWQWMASVILVLTILLVPRGTVQIVDRTITSPPQVVDNVPLGVGALASLTSATFGALTDLIETAFQTIPIPDAVLPAELSYQKNGLMFGSGLIGKATSLVFDDPLFKADLVNFILNCTAPDLAQNGPGSIDPATFAKSTDVWPLMSDPNPARFTSISSAGADPDLKTCPEAYQVLNNRMPAQTTALQYWLGVNMHPTISGAMAGSVIAPEAQAAFIRAGLAAEASESLQIIQQAALLNAIEDSSTVRSAHTGDVAALQVGAARAASMRQTNSTWRSYAKLAEQALPVVRNVIEAMVYGMFPLVVLLLMLTQGKDTAKAVGHYAEVMVWIQLWPPLYAILNYIGCIYAQHELRASGFIESGVFGLSMRTKDLINTTSISGQSVVGYLTLAVPYMAWSLLKRMETFGTVMVGGIAAMQSTISANVGAAAVGNTSMGNTSLGQVNVTPMTSSPFFARTQSNVSGDVDTQHVMSGRIATSKLMNEGAGSLVVSQKMASEMSQSARQSAAASKGQMESAGRDLASARSDALTYISSHRDGLSDLSTHSVGTSEGLQTALGNVSSIAKARSRDWGVSTDQAFKVLLGASAGAEISFGVNFGAKAETTSAAGATATNTEALRLASLSSEEKRAIASLGTELKKSDSLATLIGRDHADGKEIAARLTASHSRMHSASASYQQSLERAEQWSRVEGSAINGSVDIAKSPEFRDLFLQLQPKGPSSQAQKMVLDNFVGSMQTIVAKGLPSSPTEFRDGSPIPASGQEVRERHDRDAAQLPTDAAVRAQHQADRARVPAAKRIDPERKLPDTLGVPGQVDAAGARHAAADAAMKDSFTEKAGKPVPGWNPEPFAKNAERAAAGLEVAGKAPAVPPAAAQTKPGAPPAGNTAAPTPTPPPPPQNGRQ